MTGLSSRKVREIMAERMPGRKVSKDAVLTFKASLDQTINYILARAAQIHDYNNHVAKQMGYRPRARMNAKDIRLATGVESEGGTGNHH